MWWSRRAGREDLLREATVDLLQEVGRQNGGGKAFGCSAADGRVEPGTFGMRRDHS